MARPRGISAGSRCAEMGLGEIAATLGTLGIEYRVLESSDDGAVLVLPEYGRVLGLWPHRSGENALWVNPDFLRLLQIGAKDDRWMNPGGDRMWLAPRDEFFSGETEGFMDSLVVPSALDPGRYAGVSERGGYCMESRGEILASRSCVRMGFRIVRRLRPIEGSRLAERWGAPWLRQAGYEEEAILEVSGDCPVSAGLWNVTQVRGEGEAWVPLRKYWGDTALADLPPGSVGLASGCAVMHFHGGDAFRISFSAEEADARVLCFQERDAGRAQLLVKEFERTTAAAYDGPLVECSRGREGGAGEFACFSPAAGGSSGERRIQWRSSLCAFSGRSEEVKAFLRNIVS
jgi:hypothetical protein